mgnify:CR=1 FL=1
MANTHPANIGDVVKHLVLCEALATQPRRYIESHAGAYSYDLATVADPGPGGIWDFAHAANANRDLQNSAYARIARPLAGTREKPGLYLGSVALAAQLLERGTPIVAAETNTRTAERLRHDAAGADQGHAITVVNSDGLDLVVAEARAGDLVLIDPFDADAKSHGGLTSFDAFTHTAASGATALLWHALTPSATDQQGRGATVSSDGADLRIEVHLGQKAAGLLAFRLLAANLPDGLTNQLVAPDEALLISLIGG